MELYRPFNSPLPENMPVCGHLALRANYTNAAVLDLTTKLLTGLPEWAPVMIDMVELEQGTSDPGVICSACYAVIRAAGAIRSMHKGPVGVFGAPPRDGAGVYAFQGKNGPGRTFACILNIIHDTDMLRHVDWIMPALYPVGATSWSSWVPGYLLTAQAMTWHYPWLSCVPVFWDWCSSPNGYVRAPDSDVGSAIQFAAAIGCRCGVMWWDPAGPGISPQLAEWRKMARVAEATKGETK